MNLISILLLPIDLLIQSILPDLSNAFTQIGVMFNYIGTSLGWAVSLSGLSSASLILIASYYAFKLTAPMFFYFIKLALSWYNKIKL